MKSHHEQSGSWRRHYWPWVLAASLCGCSNGGPPSEDAVQARREEILRGQPDTQHAAVVALRQPGGRCTGTVVDAHDDSVWILTAAHCVSELDDQGEIKEPLTTVNPNEMEVRTGSDSADTAATSCPLRGADVRVAPGYDGFPGNTNDVALVRAVGDCASLEPLPWLTPESDNIGVGEAVTLVGFGQTEEGANTLRRAAPQRVAWLNEHFIGIDQTNGVGACSGDSGGPVLVFRGGRAAVAAVNSIAEGTIAEPCSRASTSTRMARFSDFIAETLGHTVTSDSSARSHKEGGCNVSRPKSSGPMPAVTFVSLVGLALLLRQRKPNRVSSRHRQSL